LKVKIEAMRTGWIVAGIAGALAIAVPAVAEAPQDINPFARTLLADQNAERDRKGVERMTWSHDLAQQAQSWADRLARDDRMYHSDRQSRHGAGENLWVGPVGYYGADDMIDLFLAEKKHYRPGTFPQVSKTGRWEDVGHYTQIIWPGTKQVGCAVAHNRQHDFLVCRYFPAGNVFGHAVN
jgi:hypothetical protein